MVINLKFVVVPSVETYTKRINAVKAEIMQVLDIALIDFLMVSSVFKKYGQFSSPANASEAAARLSLAVKELQYMDTFSQKLDHIIKLNQSIIQPVQNDSDVAMGPADHAGFIFKLNYFQAMVAADEFLVTVTDLKKNLHELHDHIIMVTQLDFHESSYFRHISEIDEKLNHLKSLLNQLQQERYREAPVAINQIEHEMRKISDLYTMTSERFVLLWMIKNERETGEELLRQYKEDGYEQVDEEIDLF